MGVDINWEKQTSWFYILPVIFSSTYDFSKMTGIPGTLTGSESRLPVG